MKLTPSNHIEITDLDSIEQDEIEEFCTYDNPMYYETIRQGRSVWNIDAQIKLAQRTERGLIAPVGLVYDVLMAIPVTNTAAALFRRGARHSFTSL